jgi:hypothetical protein
VDHNPARLLLVLLPPGERRLEFAEPMGTPAVLSSRIAELLPGTTFDADRHGTFRRGGYEITFDFVAERTAIAQATAIEVTVGRGEGFTALKRIVEKTGWQVVDPATVNPIDLDRSRVTGAITLVSAAAAAQPGKSAQAAPSPRMMGVVAAGLLLLVGAGWLVWQWNRGALFVRSAPVSASEIAAGPPPYRHLPPMPKSREAADARKAAAAQFVLAAEEIRGRLERLKDLAPEFRADEIVHQMIQFREAASLFPAKVGENGYMGPDRLSDAAFFAQLQTTPRLPAWFGQPQRDGYVFDFTGDDCTWRAHMVELGTLCFGYVYSARPLDTSGAKRSYALFSADQRVHYRLGGGVPSQGDPVVEVASSSNATSPSQQAALQEAYALRDLRQAASAETAVVAMLGRGYVSPERLTEESTYVNTKIPPMLPAYFMQSERQGYRFEFGGTNQMRAPTPFGGAFESFVYAAIPQDKDAAGRRRFALYPDGKIYATTEHRLPARQDTLIEPQ